MSKPEPTALANALRDARSSTQRSLRAIEHLRLELSYGPEEKAAETLAFHDGEVFVMGRMLATINARLLALRRDIPERLLVKTPTKEAGHE